MSDFVKWGEVKSSDYDAARDPNNELMLELDDTAWALKAQYHALCCQAAIIALVMVFSLLFVIAAYDRFGVLPIALYYLLLGLLYYRNDLARQDNREGYLILQNRIDTLAEYQRIQGERNEYLKGGPRLADKLRQAGYQELSPEAFKSNLERHENG